VIVADSSVWINFQRLPESPDAMAFDTLLAADEVVLVAPVLTELLRGARDEKSYRFYRDFLSALKYVEADRETWILAGEISHALDRRGLRVALGDLLIATLAIQNDLPLYALDGDFDKIHMVRSIKRYRPSEEMGREGAVTVR